MTGHLSAFLNCDGMERTCPNVFAGGAATFWVTRDWAKEAGWSHSKARGVDLCPSCTRARAFPSPYVHVSDPMETHWVSSEPEICEACQWSVRKVLGEEIGHYPDCERRPR